MENKEVLVSVIIPVRNRADIVTRTLDSIARQVFQSFELILVDNGSTDGTRSVLENWRDAHASDGFAIRITDCPEPGAPAARNTGLELARAPWVMFFDSDDTMAPTHMPAVAEAISENSSAEIIGWDTLHFHRDGRTVRGRFYGKDMQRHNLFNGAMATQRWCARTDLVRSAGGWNNAVSFWNDIELGARMLATGAEVAYIGQGGVHVHESESSITSAGTTDPTRMEAALESIEKTIGAKGHDWCEIKRAIQYALLSRRGIADGRALLNARHPSLKMRLVFEYTRLGGRGAAMLAAR